MSKQLNEVFVSHMERRCPYCGFEDVIRTDEEDFEEGSYLFEYECSRCVETFHEIYSKDAVYSDYYAGSQSIRADLSTLDIPMKKD